MKAYKPIDAQEALALIEAAGPEIVELMARANQVRHAAVGDEVRLCAIVNAKSGLCSEDCAFCAQSAHHDGEAPVYGLMEPDQLVEAAREARAQGAAAFSIVTSGFALDQDDDLQSILESYTRIRKELNMTCCGSLGILDREAFLRLKEAGLSRYHHNLESPKSYFTNICTTHQYEDNVQTVREARAAGLEICCGGIFGMGESAAQQVELLLSLRDLEVDSVPLNFLDPRPGTPLADNKPLTPLECLKLVAVTRLLMPDRGIVICGGRVSNLRQLQPLLLLAGANGFLTGDYLTTQGQFPADDRQMIADLGLRLAER